MASWVAPTVHSAGDLLSVSDWNNVANDVTFLYQAPYGIFPSSSTAASVTPTTFTTVPLTNTGASVNYGVTLSGNNASVSVAGIYQVVGSVGLSVGGAGSMTPLLYKNGAIALQGSQTNFDGTYGAEAQVSGLIYLNGTSDYLTLKVFQWAAGTKTISTSSTVTYLHMSFVGSL